MPATTHRLTIDPNGLTVTVDIADVYGVSITCYTADGGASAHTLPQSISSATDYFITTAGRYTVSAKVGNAEVANETVELRGGVPATYKVNPQGTPARMVEAFAQKAPGLSAQVDDYTLALTDASKIVTITKGTGVTLTVPPAASVAFPIGTAITIVQLGAGQVTIAAGAAVTVSKAAATLKLTAQYSVAKVTKVATNTWIASGDLAAS